MNFLTLSNFGSSELRVSAAPDTDVVDLLRGLPVDLEEAQWPRVWDGIAALLLASRSAKVRNAAALALGDMRYPDAVGVINSVLARRDVAMTGGTLVYVLSEIEGDVSFDAVLNLVEHGSYESRAELIMHLEKGLVAALDEARQRALRVELSRLAKGKDVDAAEAAHLALGALGLSR